MSANYRATERARYARTTARRAERRAKALARYVAGGDARAALGPRYGARPVSDPKRA